MFGVETSLVRFFAGLILFSMPAVACAQGVSPQMFDATSAGVGFRLGWQDKFKIDLFATKAVEGPTSDWRFMLFTETKF